MTHQAPNLAELADRLDRQIAEWIADAIDGDVDHARAIQLMDKASAALSASVLLRERQAQLAREKQPCCRVGGANTYPPTRRHARPTQCLNRYQRPGTHYPTEGLMKILLNFLGDAAMFLCDVAWLLVLGTISAAVLFGRLPEIADEYDEDDREQVRR